MKSRIMFGLRSNLIKSFFVDTDGVTACNPYQCPQDLGLQQHYSYIQRCLKWLKVTCVCDEAMVLSKEISGNFPLY